MRSTAEDATALTSSAPSSLIYERICLVMDDMQAVGKDNKNNQQGWSFRSIDQIKNATNPVLRKHKVFYTPEVLEHVETEQIAKSGSKMIHHKIKVKYKLFTTDGSSVAAIVCGEAADSGDKGLGKAQTYAEKVMLIQVFNIPTVDQEDVGDPDKDSHEFRAPPSVTKTQNPIIQKVLETVSGDEFEEDPRMMKREEPPPIEPLDMSWNSKNDPAPPSVDALKLAGDYVIPFNFGQNKIKGMALKDFRKPDQISNVAHATLESWGFLKKVYDWAVSVPDPKPHLTDFIKQFRLYSTYFDSHRAA